jgi:hypothetical protein
MRARDLSKLLAAYGRGKPRNKPKEVLADAAYDIEAIRVYLLRRGIKCCIPENKRNQKKDCERKANEI